MPLIEGLFFGGKKMKSMHLQIRCTEESLGFTLWANFVALRLSCGTASLAPLVTPLDSHINSGIIPHDSPAATWFQFQALSIRFIICPWYIYSRVCHDQLCHFQSLICHMCSLRTETWRWRSMTNTFTAGVISSRPPRRTPAMRGKWVWHQHRHRVLELRATLSYLYHCEDRLHSNAKIMNNANKQINTTYMKCGDSIWLLLPHKDREPVNLAGR